MVVSTFFLKVEGVAGKFPAGNRQIVAAAEFSINPQPAHRLQNYLQLSLQVVAGAGHYKSKVEIAQVVENGAAARQAPGQLFAVVLQFLAPALLPGILIAADDHSALVLPEVEDDLVLSQRSQQVFLQGQVVPGVIAGGTYYFGPWHEQTLHKPVLLQPDYSKKKGPAGPFFTSAPGRRCPGRRRCTTWPGRSWHCGASFRR